VLSLVDRPPSHVNHTQHPQLRVQYDGRLSVAQRRADPSASAKTCSTWIKFHVYIGQTHTDTGRSPVCDFMSTDLVGGPTS